MVLFALSCFGLLLFLWLSFGGPIPLKPKGYQFKVAFPEATQLGLEADVRVAGVSVGKVRDKELDPAHRNRTVATIELDRKYAPIAKDARAILRQKTLLGETYVELDARRQARGGRGARRRLAGRRAGGQDGRARRDLPGARPQDPQGVPGLAAGPRPRRSRAAGRTSTTRSATCPPSPTTATTC